MSFDNASPSPSPSPPSPARRARSGLIVLTAVLSELLIIAASNNQAVTDWVNRRAGDSSRLLARFAVASQSYAWRVTDLHDGRHLLLLGLVRDGVVLVLTGLLVLTVVRGPVTFGRAFFGTWMAVVAATMVGLLAAGAAYPSPYLSPGNRAVQRAFTPQVSAYGLWAALGLGLVVGLLTAIVAVTTRRRPAAPPAFAASPPPAEGQQLPPGWPAYQESPPAPPPWPQDATPLSTAAPSRQDDHPTAALPRYQEPERPRFEEPQRPGWQETEAPRWHESDAASSTTGEQAGASADAPTTALPTISDNGATAAGPAAPEAAPADAQDTRAMRIDEDEQRPG